MAKSDSVYCPTRELLRLVHLGAKSEVSEYVAAADSVRSLVALNLRSELTQVPTKMMPYYERLQALDNL